MTFARIKRGELLERLECAQNISNKELIEISPDEVEHLRDKGFQKIKSKNNKVEQELHAKYRVEYSNAYKILGNADAPIEDIQKAKQFLLFFNNTLKKSKEVTKEEEYIKNKYGNMDN